MLEYIKNRFNPYEVIDALLDRKETREVIINDFISMKKDYENLENLYKESLKKQKELPDKVQIQNTPYGQEIMLCGKRIQIENPKPKVFTSEEVQEILNNARVKM